MRDSLTECLSGLKKRNLDAFLVTKEANVSYLSGFSGQESCLLLTNKDNWFITDFRYLEQAKKEVKRCEIIKRKDSWVKLIGDLTAKHRIRSLGFESDNITFTEYNMLTSNLRGLRLTPVKDLVEEMREIKTPSEIRIIRRAVEFACETHDFLRESIRQGMSEQEVAKEAEYFIRKGRVIRKIAFEIIVAGGSRASQPHARTSVRKLNGSETIIIDLGVWYNGYNSDLTRTLFLDKISKKARVVYNVALEAQKRAIQAIKPGVRVSTVDRTARDFISMRGYGKYFGHALGHGIGREVHELPKISSMEKKALREGMVFTVEPGVYIPGWGGVRIEDMVLVTKNGCEVLSANLNKSI